MVYPIGRITRPILSYPVKGVIGEENLPKGRPFIIASKHNSFIDPMLLAMVLTKYMKRKKIYFISAMMLFFDLIAHLFLSEFGGSIPLKDKVHGGFIRSAMRKLKKGQVVCIFPEGMPNKRSDMREGKTGVARLVLRSRIPVVPVGIQGTLHFWSRLKWVPRPRKRIIITIGKPMYFKEYFGKDYDYPVLQKVTRKIMKEIAALVGKKYRY